jgi:putative transposase
MEYYRKSSHTVYDLKYHLVWVTKYRKSVLRGEIAGRVRDLIREICKANDVEIIKTEY